MYTITQQATAMTDERPDATRQERRERKLVAERDRMPKHGARLAQVVANAIIKRAGRIRKRR